MQALPARLWEWLVRSALLAYAVPAGVAPCPAGKGGWFGRARLEPASRLPSSGGAMSVR